MDAPKWIESDNLYNLERERKKNYRLLTLYKRNEEKRVFLSYMCKKYTELIDWKSRSYKTNKFIREWSFDHWYS